jgi:ribosome maturation factor RimP
VFSKKQIIILRYRQDLYIEEAGKTKTIELTNLADKKTLLLVQPGDQVSILPKRSKIFIQTEDKKYIGMLPDSVGMRLTSLIKGGNEYTAFVKAIGDKTVTVFIRETKRATRFKNQPSFSII